MNRNLFTAGIFFACVLAAEAHIGSPDVFFDGKAGAHSVFASVRPPKALPGSALVSVKLRDAGVQSVSLVPILWQAGSQSSPEPVQAHPVVGETNLWEGEVWLLRPGSYTIRIAVESPKGKGEANVPVNALGIANQPMKNSLRLGLLALGLLLFFIAIALVHAITRDGFVPADLDPGPMQMRRARFVTIIAFLLLTAGLAAGAIRWRKMDSDFRNFGAQKPEPVIAEIKSETNHVSLQLRQSDQSLALASWANLAPDHGKLMHLFLIRQPGLDAFAHLHPIRQDEHRFSLELPSLPGGNYELYGDITFENGISQTLLTQVALPQSLSNISFTPVILTNFTQDVFCGFNRGPSSTSGGRDMDDSWHVENLSRRENNFALARDSMVCRLMGGYTLIFENAADVAAGRASFLRFSAYAVDGSEVPLQPYMGMLGHAVVRRSDGSVFAHLHPMGSFSMAAQEAFQKQSGLNSGSIRQAVTPDSSSNRVNFPYEFPKPGRYRLWVQIRLGGRVLTGTYNVEVRTVRGS